MNPAVRSWFNGTRLFLTFAFALAFLPSLILSANPIEDWQSIHYSRGAGFVGLAAGEGVIVAVDGSGKIISWPQNNPAQKTTFTATAPLRGITFGNGQFVVAGWEGQILTSTDGRNWIRRVTGGPWALHEIKFGNGVFLAASSATLLRSTNATDWASSPLPAPSAFPNLFFAGGTFLLAMNPGTNFLSRNGLQWTPAPSGTAEGLYSIGFGNSLFIAFNIKNEILTSPDALTWTKRGILPKVLRPGSLVEGNGYLVTVGGNSRAFSRDGINWTAITADKHHNDLIFANGSFLVAGYEHIQQSPSFATLRFESPNVITVAGVPNTQYHIESSNQISSSTLWTLQHTVLTSPTGLSISWTDPRLSTAPARFYRAVGAK
jgi:hypothetical protein